MIFSKQKIKLVFFLFFSFAILLANVNLVFAQTQNPYTQKGSSYTGVSDQIKKYLCAPSDNSNISGNANIVNGSTVKVSGQGDLYSCINKLYRLAIIVGATISVFFIVIAGYLYMSAEGNNESVSKAKDMLATSLTGLVLLMGGYLLLKTINPDLVKFPKLQLPSVALDTTGWDDWTQVIDSSGNVTGVKNSSGQIFNALGSNDPALITQAGCGWQDAARFQKEAARIQPEIFAAVVEICKAGSAKGKIQISSVSSGQHAKNSYHYRFCAVDFADGSQAFRSSPAGKAAEAKASSLGLQVNPGTDARKYDHIHIDLDTACKN